MYSPSPSTQPYAPSLHAYTPNPRTINLDTEIRPYHSTVERDLIDSLAELYSILRTLDSLEKAFQKDALPDTEYEVIARKMCQQYASIIADSNVANAFGSLDSFATEWGLECPRAIETLKAGLPRTEMFRVQAGPASTAVATNGSLNNAAAVLAATENFITFLDALKLGLTTKQQLHPILADVIQSVNKVTDRDFEHRGKIVAWLIRLNQMRANEELGEDEVAELGWDMERAYNGFKSVITT